LKEGENVEPTTLDTIVTSVTAQTTALEGIIPGLAAAALGVAVLIFGVKVGWRLVKSLARG
jgi:hypothetical protein